MSVYDGAVAAYRETTKWLTAVLPLGSLAAATATVGPGLVRSARRSSGVVDWASHHWLAGVCVVVVVLGVAAILFWGGRVLSVAPRDLGHLQDPSFTPRLATAIGEGVTAPEFFTVDSFQKCMAELANGWDQPTPSTAEERNLGRLRVAVDNLRQWAIFDSVKGAFRDFVIAFSVSSVAIALAVITAISQLSGGPNIDAPTVVSVRVDSDGQVELTTSTGCTNASLTTFVAIEGTWRFPTLSVDGPGCRFASTWTPSTGHFELRPTP